MNKQETRPTAQELTNITTKQAESDMQAAKRYGQLGIARTKAGLVNLSYHADTKQYEARNRNGQMFIGTASEIKPKLAALYNVIQ